MTDIRFTQRGSGDLAFDENGVARRTVGKVKGKALKKWAKRQARKPLFVSRYDPATVDPRAIELGIVPRE